MQIKETIKKNSMLLIDLFIQCYKIDYIGIYLKRNATFRMLYSNINGNKDDHYYLFGLQNNLESNGCIFTFPLDISDEIYIIVDADETLKNTSQFKDTFIKLCEYLVLLSYNSTRYDFYYLEKLLQEKQLLTNVVLNLFIKSERLYHFKINLANKIINMPDEFKNYLLKKGIKISNLNDLISILPKNISSDLQFKLDLIKLRRLTNFQIEIKDLDNIRDFVLYFYCSSYNNNTRDTIDAILVFEHRKNKLKDFISSNDEFTQNIVKFGSWEYNKESNILTLGKNSQRIIAVKDNKVKVDDLINFNKLSDYYSTIQNMLIVKLQEKRVELSFDLDITNFIGENIHLEVYGRGLTNDNSNIYYGLLKSIPSKYYHNPVQAEVDQSIGILAGSIAHEFNNVLMGTFGYIDMLRRMKNLPKEAYAYIDKLDYYAKISSTLSNKLLNYNNNEKTNKEYFDFIFLSRTVIDNVKSNFPKDITINVIENSSYALISANRMEINGIIFNICNSLRELLHDHGTINIHIDEKVLNICKKKSKKILKVDYSIKNLVGINILDIDYIKALISKNSGLFNIKIDHDFIKIEILFPIYSFNKNEEINDNTNLTNKSDYNILIIDDDLIVIDAVSMILRESGFNVISYNNPLDAIEYYKESYKDIDLILLDMVMPIMLGEEVFHNLRLINNDAMVLILSAYSKEGKVEKLLQDGAKAYIRKPIVISEFISTITYCLSKITKDTKYLDEEYALSMLDNNKRIYHNLLRRYYNEYESVANVINTYISDKDYKSIRNIVHKIKGLSLNIGSKQLYEMTITLEKELDENIYNDKKVLNFIEFHNKILKEIKNGIG